MIILCVKGAGGQFETMAVVMAVYDGCFDVLLLKYAIIKRVYLKVRSRCCVLF